MSNELRFPDPDRDREIAGALEPLLAPPTDNVAYWDGLHSRIMTRIAAAGSPAAWWNFSPAVMRAGLVAAGLAILALGALAMQTKADEARMAFQAVTETPLEVARIIPGVDEPPLRPAARMRSPDGRR